MRMRGTTIGGKAEAGATAILGVPASGVKNFLHPKNKSVKSGIPLEFPCGNRLRALRAVQPRRAGFPLAVRLAKWRTLAGEWRVGDLDPAGIRLRAPPVPGISCRPPKAGAHQNGTRPYEPDSPLFESGVTNRRRRGGGLGRWTRASGRDGPDTGMRQRFLRPVRAFRRTETAREVPRAPQSKTA